MGLMILGGLATVVVCGLARALNIAMNRAAIAETRLADAKKTEAAFKRDLAVFARELTRMEYEHNKLEHQAVQRSPCGDSLCCYCDEEMEARLLMARVVST